MDFSKDLFPFGDLLFGPDTRSVVVTTRLRRWESAFGDDRRTWSSRTLVIVLDGPVPVWNVARVMGSHSSQGRHIHTVVNRCVTNFDGLEQTGVFQRLWFKVLYKRHCVFLIDWGVGGLMRISVKQTDTHKRCMCIYTRPIAICLKFVSERGKYKAFCMLTKIYIFKTFIFAFLFPIGRIATVTPYRNGTLQKWHLTDMAPSTAAGDMGCAKNENTSSFQSRSDNGLQKQLKPWYLGVRHETYKGITTHSTQRLHRKRSCCLECVHPSRFSVRQTYCVSVEKRACAKRVYRQNLANSGTEGETYKYRGPGAEKAKKELKRVWTLL